LSDLPVFVVVENLCCVKAPFLDSAVRQALIRESVTPLWF
jgi:hypothetical protein